MTRTGPQKIPGARLDLFFGDGRYSGSDMEVNCVALHTTEGPQLVDYNAGAVAPTVTGVPDMAGRTIVWHQHFDVDESARALVHASGQPATNTANTFQIELVGTCDPAHASTWTIGGRTLRAGVDYVYWPAAPDWALHGVAWLARWLYDQHQVPLTSGLTWKAYPGSYGVSNGVRMNQSQWSQFRGWCGHQHVPQNDHGDPGNFDINRMLSMAAGDSEEIDMTPDEVRQILREELGAQLAAPQFRDNVAFAVYWWLPKFLTGEVPAAAAAQPWAQLIPQVHAVLAKLPPDVMQQLKDAVQAAMLHTVPPHTEN